MGMKNFYENTTKRFSGTITINGSNPDITSDTVTFTLKSKKTDADMDAIINKTADVSAGAGVFNFNLTKTDTDTTPTRYFYDIVWDLSSGERYVLEEGTVSVLDKVSDNV